MFESMVSLLLLLSLVSAVPDTEFVALPSAVPSSPQAGNNSKQGSPRRSERVDDRNIAQLYTRRLQRRRNNLPDLQTFVYAGLAP
jgi:hypothetical protein